jgi:hypothetical protein
LQRRHLTASELNACEGDIDEYRAGQFTVLYHNIGQAQTIELRAGETNVN